MIYVTDDVAHVTDDVAHVTDDITRVSSDGEVPVNEQFQLKVTLQHRPRL